MTNYADIEKIENLLVRGIDECGDAIVSLRDVRRAIAQAKNADVAEVVRYKDCVVPHNQWTGCPKLNGLVTSPDFYCSYGERRKEDAKIY